MFIFAKKCYYVLSTLVKMKKKHGIKVSDEQFLSILRENAGLFSLTAKAIEEKFKIKYSRQAVRERADRFKDILADIEEENLDIAEAGLKTLMSDEHTPTKLKAIELFLKTKGKRRGYSEKTEIEHSGNVQITGMQII
jgi:hypothetical protein